MRPARPLGEGGPEVEPKRWAARHDRCSSCRTTERRHRAKGLCARCYSRATERRLTSPRTPGTGPPVFTQLTEAVLRRLYVEEEQSQITIAARFGCTRQYVLYLMKLYGIPARSLSQARRNATIHMSCRPTGRLYYVYVNGSHCARFFDALYSAVPSTEFLARKYDRFRRAAQEAGKPRR